MRSRTIQSVIRLFIVLGTLHGLPCSAVANETAASFNARIDRWEVISGSTVDKEGNYIAEVNCQIAESPEAVLFTLLDIGRYKNFIPRIKDSRLVKQGANTRHAVLETAMPWPVKDAWVYVKYTYKTLGPHKYQLTWNMINGTMKQYRGEATIEPWRHKNYHSRISYKLIASLNTAAPDSVVRPGIRKVAEIVMHRVRMRVVALRKFNKLPPNLSLLYRQ